MIEGFTVTITMESSDLDSYLFLINPNKEVINEDDDIDTFNLDAQIIDHTLTQNGIYIVRASTFNLPEDGGAGYYNLTIRLKRR